MTVQIFDKVLEKIGIVVIRNPVVSSTPMVLGKNMLKDLDMSQLITEMEIFYDSTWSCEHKVIWQN